MPALSEVFVKVLSPSRFTPKRASMDGLRFDTIARRAIASRRSLLWGLLTGAISAEMLLTEADAKKQRGKKGKKKNKQGPRPLFCANLGDVCYDELLGLLPCCAGAGTCFDGALGDRCCRSTGETCARARDCCGPGFLNFNDCRDGKCCMKAQGPCLSAAGDCCGSLTCKDNTCCMPVGSQLPEHFCLEDNDCCKPGVCGLNRIGLNSRCCLEDKSPYSCLSDYECCSLTCHQGFCCTDGADPCLNDDNCCGTMVCGGYLEFPVCCYPHGALCNEGVPTGGACCDAADVCLPTPSPGGPPTCRRPD